MKRKALIILTMLLALSLLAGCGGEGKSAVTLTAKSTEKNVSAPAGSFRPVPGAEELRNGFFDPVTACQPGTAGASLKQAWAACTVFAFAHSHHLFDAAPSHLCQQLEEAWEGLDQAERDAFDESFVGLCLLVFDCFDDWETVRPTFDDAGVAETMDQLLTDRDARADWMALVSCTLTMDRGEEESAGQGIVPAPMPWPTPTPTPMPAPSTVIVTPPTPSPTPAPQPDAVKVFFFEDEKEEFSLKVGETVKLHAVAYPVGLFPDAAFKWRVNDESVIKLTVSEDTGECEVLCLKHQPGGVTLTVACNGVSGEVRIYTRN